MFYKAVPPVSKLLLLTSAAWLFSCSKESNPAPSPSDPCSGKSISITATPQSSAPCGNTGRIDVSASGSTGFTFKLNSGGTYQSSGIFEGVSAGTYTVFAKDGGGCEKSATVTVTTAGTAGPLFTAVKNLMAVTCQPCHNNSVQNGGKNWAVDCNIVQFKERIRIRAVVDGTMPQGGPELTAAEKAIITNWINAGGRFTD